MSWRPAFAAMSAFLGEPGDDVVAAMGGDEEAQGAGEWLAILSGATREERAAEVARGLAPVIAELEQVAIA
jgi:hypothetical protein